MPARPPPHAARSTLLPLRLPPCQRHSGLIEEPPSPPCYWNVLGASGIAYAPPPVRCRMGSYMASGKRVTGHLALAAAVVLAGACSPVARADEETYQPPPALALVVVVDPSSGKVPAQLRQLEDVITAGATPNEAVVV